MQGEKVIAQCSRYGVQPTAVAVLSTSLSSDAGAVVLCACGYALMLELACWGAECMGAECIDAVWACKSVVPC